jgi:hypothetical protein
MDYQYFEHVRDAESRYFEDSSSGREENMFEMNLNC